MLKLTGFLEKRAVAVPLVLVVCAGFVGFGMYSNRGRVVTAANKSAVSNAGGVPEARAVQKENVVSAAAIPAPITDPDSRESPGPTTGNKYKLNKAGSMPTIQRRSLVVTPSVVTYDGTPQSTTFTATTDDGRPVNMIMKGEGQSLPYWILSKSNESAEKTSWTMYVDASSMTPAQTFTAVVMARTMDEHANEVVYYGALTVQMP